jgi:hypothetical protein
LKAPLRAALLFVLSTLLWVNLQPVNSDSIPAVNAVFAIAFELGDNKAKP